MEGLLLHTGKNNSTAYTEGCKLCRVHASWNKNSKSVPWKNGKYNHGFSMWLKRKFQDAERNGMRLQIVLFSAPYFRFIPWKTHTMNHVNGGPIRYNTNGLNDFYNSPKTNDIAFGVMRIVHDTAMKLGVENYELFFMWENFSGWNTGGKDWVVRMAKKWTEINRKYNTAIECGTGTPYLNQIEEAKRGAGIPLTCYVEAWNIRKFIDVNKKLVSRDVFDKTKTKYIGFWPNDKLYYENKDAELKKSYFDKKNLIDNVIEEIDNISKMVIMGIHPSLHFGVMLDSRYWERNYGFSINHYDIKKHMRYIRKFIRNKKFISFLQKGRRLTESETIDFNEFLNKASNYIVEKEGV